MNYFSKIKAILTESEQKKTYLLFGLILIGTLLETFSVGAIVPAIALMVQKDVFAEKSAATESIIALIGMPTQEKLIAIAMCSIVFLYVIKNVFLALVAWKQNEFIFDVQAKLAQRLYTIYIRQPYTFHLQKNSAELVRNVTGEVGLFAGVLTNFLMVLSEFMILVSIAILLLVIEPVGSLLAFSALGGAAWAFQYFTREKLVSWGNERQLHDGLKIKHLQQGIHSVKDIKLLGRETEFLNQFNIHNLKSAKMWKLQFTLQSLPRLIFELLAVCGLTLLVLSMIYKGKSAIEIVPVLGLFAAAAFRLMPSINRVLNAAQSLRYSSPVINILNEELKLASTAKKDPESETAAEFQQKFCMTNITFQYASAVAPAIENLSMSFEPRKSIGIIGESGSGKSTLVDIILGLLSPSSGSIEVDGVDINTELRAWQNQIGYVSQSIYLTDDTLKRNIAFGVPDELINEQAVFAAIKAAQLDSVVSGLPMGVETILGERGARLSGGQRQRIGIARALYHNPSVIVLDEATSSLDMTTEREVMQSINALQGSKTIIIIAHRLSTVDQCDWLFKLENGRLVEQGPPSELLRA